MNVTHIIKKTVKMDRRDLFIIYEIISYHTRIKSIAKKETGLPAYADRPE
jgi:hypothetical protein